MIHPIHRLLFLSLPFCSQIDVCRVMWKYNISMSGCLGCSAVLITCSILRPGFLFLSLRTCVLCVCYALDGWEFRFTVTVFQFIQFCCSFLYHATFIFVCGLARWRTTRRSRRARCSRGTWKRWVPSRDFFFFNQSLQCQRFRNRINSSKTVYFWKSVILAS